MEPLNKILLTKSNLVNLNKTFLLTAFFFTAICGSYSSAQAKSNLPDNVQETFIKTYGGRITSVSEEAGKIRLQILNENKVTIIYVNPKNYAVIEVKK